MKITDFDIYKDLLQERSGLCLTSDKSYLLDSRLTPIAKKHGYADLSAMAMSLQGVPPTDLVNEIVEAMTTNETSFFRDSKPFDIFKDTALPFFKEARANERKLRIWCAAASSGQEPYTLGMILKQEAAQYPGWKFEIEGTDISKDILEQADRGLYTQFEVQRGLPIQLLVAYFEQQEDRWQIKDEIRNMVNYKYFNLLDSMVSLGQFDIVFCRNVLIYFDEATKKDILERMARQMSKDAYLFLGGAETVIGITDAFKPVTGYRGLYALSDGPHFANEPSTPAAALATPAAGTVSPAAAPTVPPAPVTRTTAPTTPPAATPAAPPTPPTAPPAAPVAPPPVSPAPSTTPTTPSSSPATPTTPSTFGKPPLASES